MTLTECYEIATIVGSILIVVQLAAGLYVYVRQNRRERVAATLHYYEEVNQEIKATKRELRQLMGGRITEESIEAIRSNREGRILLHKLLNSYERLAMGLSLGIYDTETLTKICGKSLVSNHKRLLPYIEHRRKSMNPKAWSEFSEFVERVRWKMPSIQGLPDDDEE